MSDAVLRQGRPQARLTLEETYAGAREAARSGDLGPAEALLEFLRVYLPALSSCEGADHDWTSMSRHLHERRVYRAAKALCLRGDTED